MPNNDTNVSVRKLIDDCKVVISDAEALLKETANQAGEKISATRQRVQESLQEAKNKLRNAEEVLLSKARDSVRAGTEYVQDNPWKSVGTAAGIGAVLAMLFKSKSKNNPYD